jgi:hypothetical protein
MDDETRDLLAFDQSELDAMLPPMVVEIVEDEIPEKVDPVTKPGDLWLLGAYFECEDCGKRFDYEEGNALGGECPCG